MDMTPGINSLYARQQGGSKRKIAAAVDFNAMLANLLQQANDQSATRGTAAAGAASSPANAAAGTVQTEAPVAPLTWEEDFFRKINADQDYLPKSVAEAKDNAAYYDRELGQKFADDLREHGVTGVSTPFGSNFVTMANAFRSEFVDGQYVLRATMAGFGTKYQPTPLLYPEERARYEQMMNAAGKYSEPTAEDFNSLFAKINKIGDSVDYGDLPEKFAINTVISKLAAKSAEFAEAYDKNPRQAVEEYLDELKDPTNWDPHLTITKLEE